MIQEHIDLILFVSGTLTASMLSLFLAPRAALKAFNGLEVDDEVALFFARSSGLPVGLMGVLLLWAGFEPALRVPIVAVALIGKALFVASILTTFREHARRYRLTLVVDSACVLVFAAYLLGA